MENNSRSKVCRTCGNVFHGRLNAIYCSNECRFEFNNDLARIEKLQVNPILKILLKNREILQDLFNSGTTEIAISDLKAKRYNFNYLTHQMKSTDNKNCIFCFEYGYSISQETLNLRKYDGIL